LAILSSMPMTTSSLTLSDPHSLLARELPLIVV
jgi:hypothetical protein